MWRFPVHRGSVTDWFASTRSPQMSPIPHQKVVRQRFAARAVTAQDDVEPELGLGRGFGHAPTISLRWTFDVHVVVSPSPGAAFVGLWSGLSSRIYWHRGARAHVSPLFVARHVPPIRNPTVPP
jgi:hypothetical protein